MQRFRWVRRANIAPRLVIGFTVLSLFVVGIGGIGIYSTNAAEDKLDNTAVQMRSVVYLSDARQGIIATERSLLSAASQLDATHRAQDLSNVDTNLQGIDTAFQRFLQNDPGHTDEENRDIAIFQQTEQAWRNGITQFLALIRLNTVAADGQVRAALNGTWQSQSQTLLQTVKLLVDSNVGQVNDLTTTAQTTQYQLVRNLIVAMVLALALAALLGIVISASITQPLQTMVGMAQHIATGDIRANETAFTQLNGSDETGRLANAFRQMTQNLHDLVAQINSLGGTVTYAASQIDAATTQSAQASEQVAQTILQVAGGAQEQTNQLSEASTRVEQLADSSRTMQAESQNTLQSLNVLREAVMSTATNVQTLGEKSGQVGLIIQTITEIAEQTNLLALNAAIEAARAGEQGRGFAVVADEVRKLAERSGQATKEIAEIIHETQMETMHAVKAMEQGVQHVEESVTRAMHTEQKALEMVQKTQNISEAISSATSVSEENSAAAEEVSAATEQMSAQMQETKAYVDNLNALAQQLAQAVKAFKTDQEPTPQSLSSNPERTATLAKAA
jgi:methyl-accepting chemotaxis protein